MRRLAGSMLALALLFAGAASAAPSKKTLTVAIVGSGTVISAPAGINCKPSCTLHVKAGAKVVLTATPDSNSEFSHWSKPCGTSFTCTVKMTAAKTVRAYFSTPPPPPPSPPPPAKDGSYSGTYTDGTYFKFVVTGLSAYNFAFDNNGECDDGGTSSGDLTANGPFIIQSDGSFSGTVNYSISNGTVSVTIAGKLTPTGSATGSLHITLAFTGGPTCTSTGTWTAQDQS